MLNWFRAPAQRRRVQSGLNKGKIRNALARAVFMHRMGKIRGEVWKTKVTTPVDLRRSPPRSHCGMPNVTNSQAVSSNPMAFKSHGLYDLAHLSWLVTLKIKS